ncbi:MAG TPA: ionic transporter [Hansschlegelia sp.]
MSQRATAVSGWKSALFYALPVVSLMAGLATRFGAQPVEDMPFLFEILASAVVTALLLSTVFAVLHHAEEVADHVGEPYGTLLLTLAVTAIEVSIIVAAMLHGENNPTLARESVFSTVMIVCSGLVGACLTLGGLRHGHQDLQRQGTSAFLSVLVALSVLTLVLPNYTLGTDPGTFSTAQLAFVSGLAVLLYAAFVFAQTVGSREDFVESLSSPAEKLERSADGRRVGVNALLLVSGLLGVVLLAEQVAAGVENGLTALQVPQADAIMGALIASLVLMPEALSAIRAASNNELQRSLNVALGSACATIGLTIPGVAAASLISGRQLMLGLGPGDSVLLVLALATSVLSFGTGRTTVLTGLVHLVVFVSYLFLIAVP